jgi:hypothetical protein
MKRLFDFLKRLLFILLIFIFGVPIYARNEGNDYKRPNITYSKNKYKAKYNDNKDKHDTYKYKHSHNKYHKHHPNVYHSYKRKYYTRPYYYIVVGHNNHVYKVYNNGLRVHYTTVCWCK